MRTKKSDRILWNLNKMVMDLQTPGDDWPSLLGKAYDKRIYGLAEDSGIGFYHIDEMEPHWYEKTGIKPIFVLAYKKDFESAKSEDERNERYGVKPWCKDHLLGKIHWKSTVYK